jgi:acyl-CoA synthetase (AMP-forming)/AMP-acid ligase II
MWANIKALGYTDDDKTLLVLPLAHAYGLIHQCLCHLALGATISIPPSPLAPPLLIRALNRFSTTTLAAVPPVLDVMSEGVERAGKPPTALRMITIGAARAQAAQIARLRAAMPDLRIAITYGLTEAGPRVSTHFVTSDRIDTTCVGAPLPNCQIRMKPISGGLTEVCVRSRSLMESYCDEATDSAAVLLPTGDLGVLEEGELYLRGRLRRVIKRGGLLVNPDVIEHVIESLPFVKAAIVEADVHPFWGEVAVATVYLEKSAAHVTAADVQDFCVQHLPEQERPYRIVIREHEHPSSVSKKEQRLFSVDGARDAL